LIKIVHGSPRFAPIYKAEQVMVVVK